MRFTTLSILVLFFATQAFAGDNLRITKRHRVAICEAASDDLRGEDVDFDVNRCVADADIDVTEQRSGRGYDIQMDMDVDDSLDTNEIEVAVSCSGEFSVDLHKAEVEYMRCSVERLPAPQDPDEDDGSDDDGDWDASDDGDSDDGGWGDDEGFTDAV